MTHSNLLWISTSPSLKWADTKLICELAQNRRLYLWEYCQTEDEASSPDVAEALLYDYFKQGDRQPMHIIGHGISGVVGLLFAQRHPEYVRSLSLLSVGAKALSTWHAHYYVKRNLFEGSQIQTLMHMAHQLFGASSTYSLRQLADFLQRDLGRSPCPHSLHKVKTLSAERLSAPLLVCGGEYDSITDANAIYDWYEWLKPADASWSCPQGRHFFHHEKPQLTGQTIHQFMTKVEQIPKDNLGRSSSRVGVSEEIPSRAKG